MWALSLAPGFLTHVSGMQNSVCKTAALAMEGS